MDGTDLTQLVTSRLEDNCNLFAKGHDSIDNKAKIPDRRCKGSFGLTNTDSFGYVRKSWINSVVSCKRELLSFNLLRIIQFGFFY